MKLATINRWLTRIGLVLVVAIDLARPGHNIRLWVERFSGYQKRTR